VLKRKETGFVQTIKQELIDKSADSSGFADPEKKRGELRLKFYALTDEAKAKFSERKYTIAFENDGAENDDTASDRDESNVAGDCPNIDDLPPATPARTTQSNSDTPFIRRRLDRMSL
jgi:hypothetical protein